MNKYNVDDVIIYREGLCACSVCVPADMPTDEIERLIPSTGIKSQWKVSKNKTFSGGETNPCPCNTMPARRKHVLMEC